MMETGWSARRVTRQLGHSDCVVRRRWDRWVREISFTKGPGSGHPQQTSRREDCHIWCHARGNWTAAEWNQIVFREESRFDLSSDDNRVRVWRYHGDSLNPAFALQRHTALTAGVMVWGTIAYNIRSPVIFIHSTVTAQRYVHDILPDPRICLQLSISGIILDDELGIPRV
ncbi:transposable element Tcb2 transposase [Trichonephila clavipes]|nr:transposable element Tcb2 transposase [Trichonephila clavipes]